MMKIRLRFLIVLCVCSPLLLRAQTAVWQNPMWSLSLGGTDWTGVGCLNGNQPGWMWGYVTKDANGVPHIKMDYCDAASGNWVTIAWDNPAQTPAASPGPQFSDDEMPSGAHDGKNAAFTLAHAPVTGSVPVVVLNGIVQRINADYKLSGATITFTTAPGSSDTMAVWYRY